MNPLLRSTSQKQILFFYSASSSLSAILSPNSFFKYIWYSSSFTSASTLLTLSAWRSNFFRALQYFTLYIQLDVLNLLLLFLSLFRCSRYTSLLWLISRSLLLSCWLAFTTPQYSSCMASLLLLTIRIFSYILLFSTSVSSSLFSMSSMPLFTFINSVLSTYNSDPSLYFSCALISFSLRINILLISRILSSISLLILFTLLVSCSSLFLQEISSIALFFLILVSNSLLNSSIISPFFFSSQSKSLGMYSINSLIDMDVELLVSTLSFFLSTLYVRESFSCLRTSFSFLFSCLMLFSFRSQQFLTLHSYSMSECGIVYLCLCFYQNMLLFRLDIRYFSEGLGVGQARDLLRWFDRDQLIIILVHLGYIIQQLGHLSIYNIDRQQMDKQPFNPKWSFRTQSHRTESFIKKSLRQYDAFVGRQLDKLPPALRYFRLPIRPVSIVLIFMLIAGNNVILKKVT